jgi:hypothetical protein
MNRDDYSLAIDIAYMPSLDYQFIADYSVHRRPPSPRFHLIDFAEGRLTSGRAKGRAILGDRPWPALVCSS